MYDLWSQDQDDVRWRIKWPQSVIHVMHVRNNLLLFHCQHSSAVKNALYYLFFFHVFILGEINRTRSFTSFLNIFWGLNWLNLKLRPTLDCIIHLIMIFKLPYKCLESLIFANTPTTLICRIFKYYGPSKYQNCLVFE